MVLDADPIVKNRKLWMGAMFHIEQWTMLPPILMERYLIAADRMLTEAIPASPRPPVKTGFTTAGMRGQGGMDSDCRRGFSLAGLGTSSAA